MPSFKPYISPSSLSTRHRAANADQEAANEKNKNTRKFPYDKTNPHHVLLNGDGLVLSLDTNELIRLAKERHAFIKSRRENDPGNPRSYACKQTTQRINSENGLINNERLTDQQYEEAKKKAKKEYDKICRDYANETTIGESAFDGLVSDWVRKNDKVINFLRNLPTNAEVFVERDNYITRDHHAKAQLDKIVRRLRSANIFQGNWKWTEQGKRLLASLGYDVGPNQRSSALNEIEKSHLLEKGINRKTVFSGELKHDPRKTKIRPTFLLNNPRRENESVRERQKDRPRLQRLQLAYDLSQIKKSISRCEGDLKHFEQKIQEAAKNVAGPEFDRATEKEKQAMLNTDKAFQKARKGYSSSRKAFLIFKESLSQAERSLEEFDHLTIQKIEDAQEKEALLRKVIRDTTGKFRRLSADKSLADVVILAGDYKGLPLRDIPIDYLLMVELGVNPDRNHHFTFSKDGKDYRIQFPAKYVYIQRWGSWLTDRVKQYLRSPHGKRRLLDHYGHEFSSSIDFLVRGGSLHKQKIEQTKKKRTDVKGQVKESNPADAQLGYTSSGFLTQIKVVDEHQGMKENERSQEIQKHLHSPVGLTDNQKAKLDRKRKEAQSIYKSWQDNIEKQTKNGVPLGRARERTEADYKRNMERLDYRHLYEDALDMGYTPEKAKNFAMKWMQETDPNSKVWRNPPQFWDSTPHKSEKKEREQDDYLHTRDWLRRNLAQYKPKEFMYLFYPPKDLKKGYTPREEAEARKAYYTLRSDILQTDPLDIYAARGDDALEPVITQSTRRDGGKSIVMSAMREARKLQGTKAGWRAHADYWRELKASEMNKDARNGPWEVARQFDQAIDDVIASGNREHMEAMQFRLRELFHDTKYEQIKKAGNPEGLSTSELTEIQNLPYDESFADDPEAPFVRYMHNKLQHGINLFAHPDVIPFETMAPESEELTALSQVAYPDQLPPNDNVDTPLINKILPYLDVEDNADLEYFGSDRDEFDRKQVDESLDFTRNVSPLQIEGARRSEEQTLTSREIDDLNSPDLYSNEFNNLRTGSPSPHFWKFYNKTENNTAYDRAEPEDIADVRRKSFFPF